MKTCALIVMDGFGIGDRGPGDAVAGAKTPCLDALREKYVNTTLSASGLDVGLPAGQMGNSEVGHTNLGAGRIVYQDIARIDKSISDGDFFKNKNLVKPIKAAAKTGAVHLLGLCSDGGVHSHINHLKALIDLCKKLKAKRVVVHIITDGRDTAPKSALTYVNDLKEKCDKLGVVAGTVCGRYFAMDRDNRWDRVEKAYNAIVFAQGTKAETATTAIEYAYEQNATDEFIEPTVIGEYDGVRDGDTIIFYNFRSDRAREITRAFVDPGFQGFSRREVVTTNFVCMTEYDAQMPCVTVAFPPKDIKETLGEVVAKAGLTQVRLAETEKYAHVTFFFNGGVEEPNQGETRVVVPSPKVATYDLAPEMSASEVLARALECVGKYDVMILNFANCDMVGHTGNFAAAVRAVETVDTCVGQLVTSIVSGGGTVLVTADHGNAEKMLDETGGKFTAHTTNPVPLIVAGQNFEIAGGAKLKSGKLCDVAPTILKILGLHRPSVMDGEPLI